MLAGASEPPPSTMRSAPVAKAAVSSRAKKATARPMSSGRPARGRGWNLDSCCFTSDSLLDGGARVGEKENQAIQVRRTYHVVGEKYL